MSSEKDNAVVVANKRRKWRRLAVIAGIVLALGCKALPPDYHTACETVVKLCTGGLIP